MIAAVLIFAATYVVMAVGKLPGYRMDRAGAALLGACLMVAAGVLSLEEAFAAVDIVLSTGALYELLEWGIAATLAPEMAEAYNGQQGDIFDPHKDMAIAVAGAVVALAVTLLVTRARRRVDAPPAPLPTPR